MTISFPLSLSQPLPAPFNSVFSWAWPKIRILLIYLALVSLLRWAWSWSTLWFWIGGLIGSLLLDLDIPAANLFHDPQFPHQIAAILPARDWSRLRYLLTTRSSDLPLTGSLTRSVLFEFLVIFLGLYTVTSGTPFSQGFVMALWFSILLEQSASYFSRGNYSSWFWQINHRVSPSWQAALLTISLFLFIIFSLLLVI
jgi:hypothetical protein